MRQKIKQLFGEWYCFCLQAERTPKHRDPADSCWPKLSIQPWTYPSGLCTPNNTALLRKPVRDSHPSEKQNLLWSRRTMGVRCTLCLQKAGHTQLQWFVPCWFFLHYVNAKSSANTPPACAKQLSTACTGTLWALDKNTSFFLPTFTWDTKGRWKKNQKKKPNGENKL